jgi:Endoplasmic Reticulum Oxidoreductin 1 (ERO1)
LGELVQQPFFRYFKVNLYCDCPFWPDDGMCSLRDCSVCECEEGEVPRPWTDAETLPPSSSFPCESADCPRAPCPSASPGPGTLTASPPGAPVLKTLTPAPKNPGFAGPLPPAPPSSEAPAAPRAQTLDPSEQNPELPAGRRTPSAQTLDPFDQNPELPAGRRTPSAQNLHPFDQNPELPAGRRTPSAQNPPPLTQSPGPQMAESQYPGGRRSFPVVETGDLAPGVSPPPSLLSSALGPHNLSGQVQDHRPLICFQVTGP